MTRPLDWPEIRREVSIAVACIKASAVVAAQFAEQAQQVAA
jgi:hypothetical protein